MTDRLSGYKVLTLSSIASSIANSLYRFVDVLPDSSKDVRSVMGTLFEIKILLRELDYLFQEPRFNKLATDLLDDVVLGVGACSRSLTELDRIVLRAERKSASASKGAVTEREERLAQKSWTEIQFAFRNQDGGSIKSRLSTHKQFLFHLAGLLKNVYATSSSSKRRESNPEYSKLKSEIHHLASAQEKVNQRMRQMEESHRRTIEQQTFLSRYPQQGNSPNGGTMPGAFPGAPPPTPPYDSPPRRPYSTPITVPSPFLPPDYRYVPMVDTRPMTPAASPLAPVSPASSGGYSQGRSRRYSQVWEDDRSNSSSERTGTPPSPPNMWAPPPGAASTRQPGLGGYGRDQWGRWPSVDSGRFR